jgi:putative intracellular protease/amidase
MPSPLTLSSKEANAVPEAVVAVAAEADAVAVVVAAVAHAVVLLLSEKRSPLRDCCSAEKLT